MDIHFFAYSIRLVIVFFETTKIQDTSDIAPAY